MSPKYLIYKFIQLRLHHPMKAIRHITDAFIPNSCRALSSKGSNATGLSPRQLGHG